MASLATEKYAHMDFPMFWHLEELRLDGRVALTEALAKRQSLESGTNMQWRLFAIDLVISFEELTIGNHVLALASLAQCDNDIARMQACDHPLSKYCLEALQHVVVASRGFVLSAMPGLLPKATTLLDDCLDKFKENIKLSNFQSALIGIRSEVFMAYGVPGARKAKEYIGEALKIDNTVAEWHFLYGKCLGRLRRIFTYTDIPSEFELKHHELAVSLSEGKVPYYIVYLAQCQREMAFRMGRCAEVDVPLTEKCKSLFDESVKNYHKALKLADNCCHVLARCALGFLKLPMDTYGDGRLAYNIMSTVLDSCPDNPMYHHIWALINERKLRDPKTALIYFENAARKNVFVGWMDLVRLTYLEHREAYNPTLDLVDMLTAFPDDHLKDRILVQIGSFYFFQKNYIFKALEYIMDVFNRDAASQNLTIHYNVFMALGHPIDLLPIIFDECRMKCARPNTKDFLKKRCKEVVILWTLIYPELAKEKPFDRRKEILQESFLYTHPWARGRGRDRQRKPGAKSVIKTRSSARSKSEGSKIFEKKKKLQFKAYIPHPSSILKGWLTEEEQLAKHESREKWKNVKRRSKEDNSPKNSCTRSHSLGSDTGTGRGGRGISQADSNWRLDSSDARGASDSRRSSQDTSWRSNSRSGGAAADDSAQSHLDSSTTMQYREFSRSLSRESGTGAPLANWRAEQVAGGMDPAERAILPESKFFTKINRVSWSNISDPSAWPALGRAPSRASPNKTYVNWRASLGPSPSRSPPPLEPPPLQPPPLQPPPLQPPPPISSTDATGDDADNGAGKVSPSSPDVSRDEPSS